ncbi:MAG: hypothetical protein JXQ23_12030 [Clostridia bacterium]|nr:hypothetical protein [Clostridia bacterium]
MTQRKIIPDIKNGKTFDEKLMKYIVFYHHLDMSVIADKLLLRHYLKETGKIKKIDFESFLPLKNR